MIIPILNKNDVKNPISTNYCQLFIDASDKRMKLKDRKGNIIVFENSFSELDLLELEQITIVKEELQQILSENNISVSRLRFHKCISWID
jgi:hypothetical protein